ncbi:hypothetical protein SmJEL517_g03846 [Synchytrium microbalum]|uniref:Enhancer of rudimentary homolog n=1 Tax=Synchytrium microbalum TaxID=1806994 RepID=A0A507C2H8_9FUNG|nr:uncharacterized protein SmJEL517_g03846 [Synchytrium microbalum]TPX33249.1 hypothetical protein SmJEL517_g03846 [Synchytrium microbalum]
MHTILLVQKGNKNTRTYFDFETVPDMIEGIRTSYEEELSTLYPNQRQISYQLQDLMNFIDQFSEIAALVLDQNTQAYIPRSRDWIKGKAQTIFVKAAAPAPQVQYQQTQQQQHQQQHQQSQRGGRRR